MLWEAFDLAMSIAASDAPAAGGSNGEQHQQQLHQQQELQERARFLVVSATRVSDLCVGRV
jgi:hypothetical protein